MPGVFAFADTYPPRLQALALYEANWINSTEFHARMDKRAVSLVQSAHADTSAVAQAGQPASAQLEASLVPFRGGQWLMASMTYSCLDENSRMAQRKAHCLRFLQADSTGAGIIQQPPWVSNTTNMHPIAHSVRLAPPAGPPISRHKRTQGEAS